MYDRGKGGATIVGEGIVESRHDQDLINERDLHYGVVHFGWRKSPEWS